MNRALWFFALCCIAAGTAVFLLNCSAAQKLAQPPAPAPDLRGDFACYASVQPNNLYCFESASDCATARSLAGEADDANLSPCKPASVEARLAGKEPAK